MKTTVRRRWTGGQLVVETLKSLGIDRVYGVPGGQTLAITDAIIDEPAISFVTARHEGAAAVMADAAGRISGLPGVCHAVRDSCLRSAATTLTREEEKE